MQAPSHPLLHHATFGGTLATITLTACIGGSTTHLNVGGCTDNIESIAQPSVCAIWYQCYGFAVRAPAIVCLIGSIDALLNLNK